MRMCSAACHLQLFVPLWTIVWQAPLFMGFSRQEYWIGLPCPPPGDLPNPGIKFLSPVSSALQADSLLLSCWGCPPLNRVVVKLVIGTQHTMEY